MAPRPRPRRAALTVCGATLAALLGSGAREPAAAATRGPASDDFVDVVAPFVAEHCARCHDAAEAQGDVVLTGFASGDDARAEADTWRLVGELLEFDEMPPAGEPRPAEDDVRDVLAWVDATFGPADPDAAGDPGAVVLRRLNHTEYENSIRDLFGIDFPARERFPTDEVSNGFDTIGDALSISDLLFEKYVDAAEEIAAAAIVVPRRGGPPVVRLGPGELEGPSDDGVMQLYTRMEVRARTEIERGGTFRLRAEAWARQAGDELARMALRVDGETLESFEVEGTQAEPAVYEVELRLEPGRPRVGALFENDYYQPDEAKPGHGDRNLYVRWIELEGPLEPPPPSPFHVETFARFGESLGRQREERILEHLATRVWRRPPTESELSRLRRLAPDDATLDERVQIALAAMLASPSFLLRPELDPPPSEAPAVRALDSWELATRLSFFLWSSTPDEELLSLARRGELASDEVLRVQVRRMLADDRARALAENFCVQWLQLRGLEESAPDPRTFPTFDAELRDSMLEETVALFEDVRRERRDVRDLLRADYTFVDERLAEHYGVEGVTGDEPTRISLEGSPRRGLLGHASVLTATSTPTRTSPVKRGKFVLEALLGSPPPPPEPGADSIDESPDAAQAASLRERLEQHRNDPNCIVCHERMDPLGFGLEHFDGIGGWRDVDGEHAIDSSGVLPDGRSFDGAVELVDILLADDAFVRTLTEKLLTYALGRSVTRADRHTVEAILTRLDPDRPELPAILEGIVLSDAFRMRRGDTRR